MSVGLLLITHNGIGEELLGTATAMLGVCPLRTRTLSVRPNSDPDELAAEARYHLAALNQADGILVLTDMYGSTPSNVAQSLCAATSVNVVVGVNLPMLVRVLNYATLSLDELTEKALSGGRDGIFQRTDAPEAGVRP